MKSIFDIPALTHLLRKGSTAHTGQGPGNEVVREYEVNRINRLYKATGQIGQAVLKSHSREDLLKQICEIMVKHAGYRMVWIGWLNPRTHVVVPAAFSGEPAEEYLHSVRITANDKEEAKGPTGTALREGKAFICNDFLGDLHTLPWHKAAERAGIRASAAFPFRCGGEVCGTLNVYADEPNVFGEQEVALLEEVASDISYGFDKMEEEERRRKTETARHESEERFRGFAEAANQVFWITSLHPELILYVNPAFERIWGIPAASLYRDPRLWTNSIYIDDRVRVIESYSNWIEGIPGSSYDVEYRIVRPDGEMRWIADRGFILLVENNKILSVAGIAEDITVRKHAEEGLRKSEGRLREALDSMMEGCMILDSDWTYLYVNESAARHGHQKRENLIGRTMLEMYPGVTETDVFAGYRRCMEERAPQCFESKYTFPDGTTNWYEFSVHPVPEGIFVLSLDITERKRAMEALQESEQSLKEAQRIAHLGNWELDLLTNEFVCSEELYRILEIEPAQFGRSYEAFLNAIHKDDRNLVDRAYRDSVRDRTSHSIAHRLLMKDGRIKFVMQQFKTFYDHAGRPLQSIGTIQDVTNREWVEEG